MVVVRIARTQLSVEPRALALFIFCEAMIRRLEEGPAGPSGTSATGETIGGKIDVRGTGANEEGGTWRRG